MTRSHERELIGTTGTISVREWFRGAPRYVAVLVHGYGEHVGRYDHVAAALVRDGAAVYGPDHQGHGRSSGERVLIEDFEDVVTDLSGVTDEAAAEHPGVPLAVIGHSMGGLIAARYAQRHPGDLAALVLSGPLLGLGIADSLPSLDEIGGMPIDPAALSRDPEVGKAYAADPLVWHGPFKRPTLTALSACLRAVHTGGPLRAPTLWIHGGEDQIVPLDDARRGIDTICGPDLTERIYPGARHEVFNEINKREVIGDVLTFLNRALS